ncbi:MAG: UDP-N-acetylmuramoyl-tripeptide--D-alanyl-D-alanine ligase [Eubacteriales bacterium]|nr:UDP-N-acetylmuramoyl-tripeptide--D-alanyl-D-alanine ligase [Eubacteriales bacterium]
MPELTLRQAAAYCGGRVDEKYADCKICGANNDTRLIQPGQLFIVLQGARDGHDFIPMAMDRGAGAALCSRRVGDYPAIYVDDPRTALGRIARETLKAMAPKVVAVTGSVGKSTTKEMIASVLETKYRTAKTPANHNNDIGMPMAILGMAADTQAAVLEMGMNHFREIAYLSDIARPQVGVIINVGTAHLEFLGSRAGIRRAKMEITEGMAPEGTLLLNGDNDMLAALEERPVQSLHYFGCGENAAVRGSHVVQTEGRLAFDITAGGTSFPVELALEGEHFVSDALAAAAVGLALGLSAEEIQRGLRAFRNISGRQETYRAGEYTIINDCYNAGPESMAASLQVLGTKKARRLAVLGDMLELGDYAPAAHEKVGRLAAKNADLLFAFGPHAADMLAGAEAEGMTACQAFDSRQALAAALRAAALPGDVLLFKASHGMHLEQVIGAFLKQDR